MAFDERAWAAGLFEGEGCFHLRKGTPRCAMAKLVSTDEDVVRRFCCVVGVGGVAGPTHSGNVKHKPYWVWTVGSFEGVQHIVCLLWQGLCSRRRSTAAKMLSGYLAAPMKQFHRHKKPYKRLSAAEVAEILEGHRIGRANADMAYALGVSPSLVSRIITGDRHQGGAL